MIAFLYIRKLSLFRIAFQPNGKKYEKNMSIFAIKVIFEYLARNHRGLVAKYFTFYETRGSKSQRFCVLI